MSFSGDLCRSSSKRAISESLFATISNISDKIAPSAATSSSVLFSSEKKKRKNYYNCK